jgi:hypothetical protein
MGHGSWWILHLEPNQSTASGYSRTSIDHITHLTSTKQGSWKKDLHKNKVLIMRNISPTTKWDTIQTLFSMATHNGWKIHQMDVKTSFLNGDLKDNVFMSQSEGFLVKRQEHKV